MSHDFSDPLFLVDYDRAVMRELDQREWEGDDTRMIPKPPARYKASAKAWAELREHFSGLACWVCGEAWTDLHHIVPRSRSGDDVPVSEGKRESAKHRRTHRKRRK